MTFIFPSIGNFIIPIDYLSEGLKPPTSYDFFTDEINNDSDVRKLCDDHLIATRLHSILPRDTYCMYTCTSRHTCML